MQTTGAALLAVERRSPACVLMTAQDSRSAHGLLYPTAVRDGRPEQEHRQGSVDSFPPVPARPWHADQSEGVNTQVHRVGIDSYRPMR